MYHVLKTKQHVACVQLYTVYYSVLCISICKRASNISITLLVIFLTILLLRNVVTLCLSIIVFVESKYSFVHSRDFGKYGLEAI